MLVFEDLHWADDGMLDFIDQLPERLAGVPLLVVCTARPELLERRPGWGGGKRNALTASLPALSDTETAQLVASLLGTPVLDAELQAALLARAGGNPLYAEEYVRMVADGDTSSLALPETIQGIVAARIDLLPAGEKSLLQDASALGKVFWTDGLAALAGTSALRARRSPLRARAQGVRAPRGTICGRWGAAIRVRPRARARCRLRPAAARGAADPAPARGRVDRVAAVRPGRGPIRAARPSLRAGARLRRAAGIDVAADAEGAAHALRDAGDREWSLGALEQAL